MNENAAIIKKLLARIRTISGIARVYHNRADQNAQYPYCVVQSITGNDVICVGGIRIAGEYLYSIKMIDKADTITVIAPLSDSLDSSLCSFQDLSDSNARITGIIRDSTIDYVESEERINHLGGIYRVFYSKN